MPMIQPEPKLIGYSVRREGAGCRFASRVFIDNRQAEQWLADDDEDYEEYGQFSEGIRRVGEVFQRVCGKLYCGRCVERLIEQTKVR